MRGAAALLLAALLAAGVGCATRSVQRPAAGAPVGLADPTVRLRTYNGGPLGVRVQGRLRVEGRGSAVFGATAVAEQGVRIDAVSGAFSRPLLGLACLVGGACESYLPQRRELLVDPSGAWGPWLVDLLRGRLPVVGEPLRAWQLADGSVVLQLAGHGEWLTEVEFPAVGEMPRRAVYSRGSVVELEVVFGEPGRVEGWPFPGRIGLRSGQGDPEYRLEFQKVATVATLPEGALGLQTPPGTDVKTQEGTDTWSETQLPLWLPLPTR